jgi:hypothetical protein
MARLISPWKAPRQKLVRTFMARSFDPKYFRGAPGQFFDGKAYFAKQRELADEYERYYGGGVIEVQMESEDYRVRFQCFEEQYQATNWLQIAVPRDFLELFNRMTVRRIWHHE